MLNSRDISCDAVVIGTGLGGSTFAYGLARRGFEVVVVESGSIATIGAESSPKHQALLPVGRLVGGLTKTYGAAMYRLREMDFESREMESGVSPAWPFPYSALEPFYGEVEQLYKVHGSSENDASEPPRSTPWPHGPIPHQGPVRELVLRLQQRAGVGVSYIPRAIDYDPEHNGRCILCQHCDAYLCPREAKLDAEIAALRPAIATGHVHLMTETECLQVLTTPNGRGVSGVRVRNLGEEFVVHARIVALGCGLTGTPTLLWRSRNSLHPDGLSNGSGALGRNVAAHRQGWVFVLSPLIQRVPFHQKTFAINSFYEGASNWPYPLGTIQSAGYIEPLSFSRRYRPFVAAVLYNSFQTFVMSQSLASPDRCFVLADDGAMRSNTPIVNARTFAKLRSHSVDVFRSAGYRVLAPPIYDDWHWVGSARMGSDPSTSIVDSMCQSHDVNGLYVVDASVLPTAGAVNTGLTIAAVALRAAEGVRSH
jgi:choline dehydrogenase-like flavoprotein